MIAKMNRTIYAVIGVFMSCLAAAVATAQTTQTLPLVLPASNTGRESFVRIVNLSDDSGMVRMYAIDDTGERFGPERISLPANGAVHFRSTDLEWGNSDRGLSGVGDGEGNWRLEFDSSLNFGALTYIRNTDGFLTSMYDKVPVTAGTHHVIFFNPASNQSKQSRLRLVNSGMEGAEVTISARDDAGDCASGVVRLTLPAGETRTLTAQSLETGGSGFSGSFGDGAGKWRLFVTSSAPIETMSLLANATGHLANLSTVPFDASADNCRSTEPGDDHGNTRGTATVVNAPSTTAGNIETGGDRDYFRFNLASAGRLTVRTTGSLDTYGTLYRGSSRIATNDDGNTGTNFSITVPEAQAGTYYVEVRGFRNTDTGGYSLVVEFEGDGGTEGGDDHGNTRGTATVVNAPSTTAGNLETRGDIDFFRFDVPSNGYLWVYTRGRTNPNVTLYRGSNIIATDDSGTGTIGLTQVESGTYYIAVRDDGLGAYRLHIDFQPALSVPSITEWTLETIDDSHNFWFTLPSEGYLRVYTTGNCTWGSLDHINHDSIVSGGGAVTIRDGVTTSDGPRRNFRFDVGPIGPGVYYLNVTYCGILLSVPGPSTYRLHVEFSEETTPPTPPEPPTPPPPPPPPPPPEPPEPPTPPVSRCGAGGTVTAGNPCTYRIGGQTFTLSIQGTRVCFVFGCAGGNIRFVNTTINGVTLTMVTEGSGTSRRIAQISQNLVDAVVE